MFAQNKSPQMSWEPPAGEVNSFYLSPAEQAGLDGVGMDLKCWTEQLSMSARAQLLPDFIL